jgi:hypothetical protein
MSTRKRPLILLLAGLASLAAGAAAGDGFTRQFPILSCDFKSTGGNAFLKLKVGRQLYLNNQRCVDDGDCDELVELWITMLPDTKVVNFEYGGRPLAVRTRVMEEFEMVDGELDEVSRNYVADCNPMHDVYYFGEDVEDGDGNPLPDAWLAGVDGARPGILMPDRAFLLGSRYYQEIAPNAQDRAEHTSMSNEVEVPAGTFARCVEIKETSPLEPGSESVKDFCPNVGFVREGDEGLELISVAEDATSPSAKN